MIPGIDLLNTVLQVLGTQTVIYYQNTGVTIGTSGNTVPQYAAAVTVTECSFQPMPKRLYANYGFEFNEEIFSWYVSQTVIDVQRNKAGDRVDFDGSKYNVQSITPWQAIDGWVEAICIRIGDAG